MSRILSSSSAVSAVAFFAIMVFANAAVPTNKGAKNILFFIGFGGPSHRIAMMPLADALAAEGHNITFFAKDKPDGKGSKINYYVPDKVVKQFGNTGHASPIDFYTIRKGGLMTRIFLPWFANGVNICNVMYEDPEFITWIKSNTFDLVIVDGLFNECGYSIAHVHKAKLILFSVSSVLPWAMEPLGLPDETSTLPDIMLHFPSHMSFFQRLVNTLMPVIWKVSREIFYFPKLREIAKKGLGVDDFPSFAELERNISLTFVNTHVAQEFPRSLPPSVVPIGGISWVEKRKPLPKKMEDFINKGKDGFVYVSFGSFIDFTTFPEEVQQKFVKALLKFPNIQFIWKLSKFPENLPENFYVDKWLPQQEILLHPKIRLFITHSGIGGVNEAIFSSVPMICFPLFGEQDYNAQLVEEKGFGIKMEITQLNEVELENTIRRILGDDTFSKNAKLTAQRFQDRPLTPLQTGLWWTNFVLRQENTDYLRPSSMHQSWWIKRQLDVWLFLLIVLISVNSLTIYVSYKLIKRCCGGSSKAKVSSGDKKGKKKLN